MRTTTTTTAMATIPNSRSHSTSLTATISVTLYHAYAFHFAWNRQSASTALSLVLLLNQSDSTFVRRLSGKKMENRQLVGGFQRKSVKNLVCNWKRWGGEGGKSAGVLESFPAANRKYWAFCSKQIANVATI